MTGIMDVIAQFVLQNFWFLYSIFINVILLMILMLIFARLGPFATEILKVSIGVYRKPAGVLRFTNAQIASIQVREYSPVIKLDEKDPTSELVHMNREHAFQIGANKPTPNQKIGFFDKILGKKQSPEDRFNEVYSDDFFGVDINKKAVTYLFGMPLFVTVEGINSTINPMKNFTQAEQVRAASIAVEQALLANKLIVEDRFRKEIATKSDVRNWSLIVGGVLLVGIVILLVLVFGMTQTLQTFITFAQDQWKIYQPMIAKAIGDTPQVIYDGLGGSQ